MERDRDGAAVTSSPNFETDAEIDEVILRLDLTLVRPDDEDSSRSATSAQPTTGSGSSQTDNGAKHRTDTSKINGERANAQKSSANSSSSQQEDDKKKSKPLDFIRKLRQTGLQTDNHTDNGSKRKSPEPLKV